MADQGEIWDYEADRLAVTDKNLGFLREPRFAAAWRKWSEHHADVRRSTGPIHDRRWRLHIAAWAAQSCVKIPGDFAEFGAWTGVTPGIICDLVDFKKMRDRSYWLFDTFEAIPIEERWKLDPYEVRAITRKNERLYGAETHEQVRNAFAPYPNVHLVKGILPQSLAQASIHNIAFAHFDLNLFAPEGETFEAIKDRLSPGAMILLDDYAFKGHVPQYDGWNALGKKYGFTILTLPTGQGLFVCPR